MRLFETHVLLANGDDRQQRNAAAQNNSKLKREMARHDLRGRLMKLAMELQSVLGADSILALP